MFLIFEQVIYITYSSITCSKISNIPYNLVFTIKFNDFSILFTIISWDYLNLLLANEYVDDVTIPTQVIKYNHFFSKGISQSLQYSHQINHINQNTWLLWTCKLIPRRVGFKILVVSTSCNDKKLLLTYVYKRLVFSKGLKSNMFFHYYCPDREVFQIL